MTRRWQELVVPGMILAFSLAYWVQVRGQARAVILMPRGLFLLVLGLVAVVVWREVLAPSRRGQKAEGEQTASRAQDRGSPAPRRVAERLRSYRRELGLLILSVGYYAAFESLGFTLANGLFLILAFPTAGLRWKQSVGYAAVATFVLYGAAQLMQLHVPGAPWFR